jgi:hypothetical protein
MEIMHKSNHSLLHMLMEGVYQLLCVDIYLIWNKSSLFLITLYISQVVRLASFQYAPSIPPFIVPKQSKLDGEDSVFQKELDDRRYAEVAVAGGGVSVAVTRFPPEQKRPIGPLVVVGVRDGVLWLVDR